MRNDVRGPLHRRVYLGRAVKSKIETMIGRDLEHEQRAGIRHFKTGQHFAEPWRDTETGKAEPGLYELSFVDNAGHGWLVGCMWEHRRWTAVFAFRGGQTFLREEALPVLSAKMLTALNRALAKAGADGAA